LQLGAKLEIEIGMHLERELDIATVKSLLTCDPELQLIMKFGIRLTTHLQCDSLSPTTKTLLEYELGLPLGMQLEVKIDPCRQHEFGIAAMKALLLRDFTSQLKIQLQCRSSFFQPRDRDVRADPPLEGGSDPDLAGQACVDRMDG
jgi:hypothetical protein